MYRYLIVDDEPMIRYSVRHMLKQSEFPITEILEAEDGQEAIDILKKEQIHFIFIDINMPRMNGLMLAEYVYEHARDAVMCIISGYDDFKYAQTAIRYGVRAYLLKPVNRSQLYQTIAEMISEREKHSGLWMDHDQFSRYVDILFEAITEQDRSAALAAADSFIAAIAQGRPAAQTTIIRDLLNVLAGRVSDLIGEPFRMEGIMEQGCGKERNELLIHGIEALAERMEGVSKGTSYKIVENARRYLERNGWNVSLEDLSRELGINPSYFSRMFREISGMTFVAYRTELRMKRAEELLVNLEKPVSAVAMEIGYSDVTHFIRVFKRYAGQSPSEYRKDNKRMKKSQNV